MIKKGFILIYTLIVISLSFIVVTIGFSVENMRKHNNIQLEEFVLNSDGDKYKHIMFKKFNDMLHEKKVVNIKEYILKENNLIINNDDFVLKYDKNNDNFMLLQFDKSKVCKIDIYNYIIEENIVKFKYSYTSY